VFRIETEGLALVEVAKGIDVCRDILSCDAIILYAVESTRRIISTP
jgi:acyl CoA:acetate/3-ketoacid CoA transferase